MQQKDVRKGHWYDVVYEDVVFTGMATSERKFSDGRFEGMLVSIDGDVMWANPENMRPARMLDALKPATFQKKHDPVTCPAHYAGDGVIECKRAVASMAAGYDKAEGFPDSASHRMQAAVEYIWRAPLKNGVQDIDKAIEDLKIAKEAWK